MLEHVMFLLYKYALLKNRNQEIGVYICQNEKTEKHAQRKSVQEELNNSPNGRSWFHVKPKAIWINNRKNSINKSVLQLLALAVGHGQLPKPQKNDTL